MEMSDVLADLSKNANLPLEVRGLEVFRGAGMSSLQTAEVFHDGRYYGYAVLDIDKKGDIQYCAYEGEHPILAQTGDRRNKLGLHIERDEKGYFRVDSNPVPFLGFDRVDPGKLTAEEDDRRVMFLVGFGRANAHLRNHELIREAKAKQKQSA